MPWGNHIIILWQAQAERVVRPNGENKNDNNIGFSFDTIMSLLCDLWHEGIFTCKYIFIYRTQ